VSDSTFDVVNVTVDRDSHVEITFADDKVCRFELIDLRRACPCATCRTDRERGRHMKLMPLPTISNAQFVGAYALGITWNDGHSTGIYPFDALRRWCDTGRAAAAFPPDSGLPS
jgi:DUF971 family protein